jgi:TolA-binding protein
MIRVAQEKGFAWPQYFDGRVWQNQIGRQWGINSIPATFVIGPDGDVLWKGHPANLDNALAAAFKNHPPRLVDEKVLADANALADKIDAALKENGQASAIKLLAAVPADAKKDGKFAERMADIEKQLGEYATKSLAEIDPLIQDKKYVEAASRLSDLTKALGALPAGSDAKKKLSELMSNPEAKAQFEAAQKKKAADDELAVAKRMQGEGKDDQAYLRFKAVATNFAGTPAADEAKGLMAAYEQKNPGVVAKANEAAAAGKANAALGMAANYARAGRVDLAKRKYQEVIAAYPNTSYAQKAQAAIAELEGKGK